jgi:hypothetical protein
MNLSELTTYLKRFKTETIYLWNFQEDIFIKSEPAAGYWAKLPGGKEFKVQGDSELVVRTIFGRLEVTRDEYESGSVRKAYQNLIRRLSFESSLLFDITGTPVP